MDKRKSLTKLLSTHLLAYIEDNLIDGTPNDELLGMVMDEIGCMALRGETANQSFYYSCIEPRQDIASWILNEDELAQDAINAIIDFSFTINPIADPVKYHLYIVIEGMGALVYSLCDKLGVTNDRQLTPDIINQVIGELNVLINSAD